MEKNDLELSFTGKKLHDLINSNFGKRMSTDIWIAKNGKYTQELKKQWPTVRDSFYLFLKSQQSMLYFHSIFTKNLWNMQNYHKSFLKIGETSP